MSHRLAENSKSGVRAAIWGWLVWYFTPSSGFLFTVLNKDIYSTFDPANVEPFIVGTIAALGITGGAGAYYRDRKSPVEPVKAPEQVPVKAADPAIPVSPVVTKDAFIEPAGITLHGIELGPTPLRRNSGFEFSRRSLTNRTELSPFMQRTATRGLAYSPYDWVMVEAGRTFAEQVLNVENKVSKTLESMHIMNPAQAWDFYVFDESGKLLDGNSPEHKKYYVEVAQAIQDAANDEGGTITSGALHWGWDYFHVERNRKEVAFKWPADARLDVQLA